MFMVHPKPTSDEQAVLFNKLANNRLATPDTWEVELSALGNNASTWTRLMAERKLSPFHASRPVTRRQKRQSHERTFDLRPTERPWPLV
jgi:hypothetical protein